MTTTIKNDIKNAIQFVNTIKQHFEREISNMDIPLKDRWNLFAEAPDYLKNHDSWILHFNFPDGTKYEDSIDGYERHMVKNMVDVIEQVREKEFFDKYPESNGCEDYDDFSDSANVVAFKEFILSRNLGSFCVDW